MKRPITLAHGLAALGLCGLAVAGAAAGSTPAPDVTDALMPVPATRYESLLKTPPAAAPALPPPDRWQALNRALISSDAMPLTMDLQPSAPAQPATQAHQHRHGEPE